MVVSVGPHHARMAVPQQDGMPIQQGPVAPSLGRLDVESQKKEKTVIPAKTPQTWREGAGKALCGWVVLCICI